MIPDHLDPQVLAHYLARTRWFGGKGRPFSVTDVRVVGEVPGRAGDSPWVVVHLVELTYADAGAADAGGGEAATELYQVPLALYTHPQTRLDHAFLGWWEDPEHGWVHAYDALHDREAMACWLRSFGRAADGGLPPPAPGGGGLAFHRVPGHELDLGARSTLFSGEQSNSSVLFGEDSLMKVFRKVTPGVNPDVEVHEVLTRTGSDKVAALYGWLDVADDSGEVIQLAMIQQFLRTATDGWDLALSSVRTLVAEPEVPAEESGGDFAGEASRLGEALREVHDLLAEHFPTAAHGPEETARLAAAMTTRLAAAVPVVPRLGEHAPALRGLHQRLAALPSVEVQRVHGDLHLGQTLRTAAGWKIVDFEGEPARPLAERVLPDSPWRDVAGMLRSFDYAPQAVLRSRDDVDEDEAALLDARAHEWAERSKLSFLAAYAEGPLSGEQQVLLDAYVADKAVYETVYETRNRPGWVDIPLEAVARIGAS